MQAPKSSFRAAHFEQHARTTDFLPPAFEIIPRLLVLLDDPEVNSDEIADIIRVDVGLTTDVIRVANTAVYAGGTRTDSLSQAIIRLGLREIYRLVSAIITSPNVTNLDAFGFLRADLWHHSIASGFAGQILARNIRNIDPEVAYTAGLLHDIGKLVMAQVAKAEYLALIDSCKDNNEPHYIAEGNAYQTDHAHIAALLLKRWRFPDEIVSAIKFHHDLAHAPENAVALASLIYASNIVAYRLNLGSGFPSYAVDPDPAMLEPISLQPSDLAEVEHEVLTAFQREQKRLF